MHIGIYSAWSRYQVSAIFRIGHPWVPSSLYTKVVLIVLLIAVLKLVYNIKPYVYTAAVVAIILLVILLVLWHRSTATTVTSVIQLPFQLQPKRACSAKNSKPLFLMLSSFHPASRVVRVTKEHERRDGAQPAPQVAIYYVRATLCTSTRSVLEQSFA